MHDLSRTTPTPGRTFVHELIRDFRVRKEIVDVSSVTRATADEVGTRWTLVGVPSSAGGHTPGMDLGPAAIREAGLARLLRAAGDEVVDGGDVRGFRRRPDPAHLDRQNIQEVARVADETATAVATVLAAGRVPLVLGGDCTVTVGVVAGFRRAGHEAALMYVDGGPDLYTPGLIEYGNVDAMGVAHMLALPGSDEVLTTIEGSPPLLRPDQIVSYGDALPEENGDLELALLHELGIVRIPARCVHDDPDAPALAIQAIASAGLRFVVHVDVDVLAHYQMPLANMPNPDSEPWGLTIDELVEALRAFTTDDRFAGLVLTEVNPGNAPDVTALDDYVQMIVAGVGRAGRVSSRSGHTPRAPHDDSVR